MLLDVSIISREQQFCPVSMQQYDNIMTTLKPQYDNIMTTLRPHYDNFMATNNNKTTNHKSTI